MWARMHIVNTCTSLKPCNLELKTRPKQVLGSRLPLAFALPALHKLLHVPPMPKMICLGQP